MIARGGKPVARLVAIEPPPIRALGRDAGLVQIADDFDDTLSAEVLDEFES